MELEQIIPALALIAVLILVLPGFIRTNNYKRVFFKNLGIWGIIVLSLVIILYLIF
jgi:hypothetical protein|tara:strand:+ start:118 stop:285 length:168 start_codon:yes stop_codon:yes gene_type:complete